MSIVCINYKIPFSNYINEYNSYHQSSSEIIYHACDDSDINLDRNKEDADVTYINSLNKTNKISKNDDVNVFYEYYWSFLFSNNKEIFI